MKKIYGCLILGLLLVFGLIGCNGVDTFSTLTQSTTTTTTNTSTTTTTTTTSRALVSGEYRLSDLQADFDQMVMYLSFNPQIFTNQAELAAVIATQRALLVHGMTQLDLYRIMAVVVATVRCGHSMIQVPASAIEQFFDNSLAYPVVVRLIDGKLTVIEVEGETNLAVGDTIESIEGKNVSAVTQDMMRYLAADGEGTSMKTKVLSENYFSYYMLYLGNDDAIEIEYREDLTQTIHNETLERNCANTHGWVERPAYESAFMSDYAVLTIRTFQPYGSYTLDGFYGFFDGFFKEVDRLNIQRVVLDLRGNGGGDPRVASRLLAYLIASPQPYFAAQTSDYYPGLKNPVPLMQPHFDGSLVTIIDAYCFSTCGHFAALLRYHDIGTFVGEETGGGYICTDSSVDLTLGHTMMRVRTSMVAWEVAVSGAPLGRGTLPDVAAAMTLDDYRLGVDRVMQTAVDLLHN